MSNQNEFVAKEMRRYDLFIQNWLKNFLGDAESAADVKQSMFVHVLEYAKKKKIENPKALMFKIARNLAVNELRRRKRSNAIFVVTSDYSPTDITQTIPSSAPTPEEATSLKNDVHRVMEAINDLPEGQKQAVILSRMHGDNYRTIAHKLGVSESSVEKYMIKALKTIRARLEN